MTVTLTPNIPNPDGFYDTLLQAHDGLTNEQSQALNARIILTFANQIGDEAILKQAIEQAK